MPYVKSPERDEVLKLLGKYGIENGRALASVLMCSPSTAYNRMRSPEDFTVGELRRLARHGHIPIEEVRNAL